MKTALLVFLTIFFSSYLWSQQILMDGDFSDWDNISVQTEEKGDNSGLDMETLSITNDDKFYYLHITLSEELLLQEGNRLQLQLSGDNFDFLFDFGEMEGRILQSGPDPRIYHNNMGMIIAPSYSSTQFEIQIARTWNVNFSNLEIPAELNIQLVDLSSGGDQIPNTPLQYESDPDIRYSASEVTLVQPSGTFRVCSYNTLHDKIFDDEARVDYTRILRSISADIYSLQEIYDHSSAETLSRMFNIFDALEGTEWYHAKRGIDLILISRYPILYEKNVGGNAVFVVDMDGQEVMIINIHLSCCENDSQRESEIDDILDFIDSAKNNQESYILAEGTPLLIMGDTNFVGNGDQLTALTTGNFFGAGSNVELDWDSDGLATVNASTSGLNSNYTWFSEFSRFAPGRLDYIFYTDTRLEVENAFVLDSRWLPTDQLAAAGLERSNTAEASDHRPVVCDFSLIPIASDNDLPAHEITIYPVPSSDAITIENYSFECRWVLYDLHSKPVLEGTGAYVDLNQVPSGLYQLSLLHSNRPTVHKIIKL